jgi:hypothetical protein
MAKVAYFDESGNLRFAFEKSGTSTHFMITLLIAESKGPVAKVVKRVFNSLSKTDKSHSHGILHAYYERRTTRERILRLLAEKDIQIAAIVLDKQRMRVTPDKHILYASMVNMLLNRLYMYGLLNPSEYLELIPSKMETNKNRSGQFKSIVLGGVASENLSVNPAKPADDKGLQAVDFVSWSLFRKFEYGDYSYADIIGEKVAREYDFLTGGIIRQ